MFDKRTRLYTNFNYQHFFYLIKSFFTKKKNFTEFLSKFLNVKNIHLTSQGRVALFDIVNLIIEKTGKKIFYISPFTLPEVIYSIQYAGGNVVFLDIDKSTGLINENKLEKKIHTESAAVIITHLYSNTDQIKNFINRFKGKIKIIEDTAINFGAKIDGKSMGTLADYGFFSFNIVKILSTLNGGLIYISNDDDFKYYKSTVKKKNFPQINTIKLIFTAVVLKILFNNFFYQLSHYFLKYVYKNNIKFVLKNIYPILYNEYKDKTPDHYYYDFNWTMNDVGVFGLKTIEEVISFRKHKARLYERYLDQDKIKYFKFYGGENIFLDFPIIIKTKTNKYVYETLFLHGYDIKRIWYSNNARISADYNSNDFLDTEFLEQHILCLPTHNNINEKDIINICKLINKTL